MTAVRFDRRGDIFGVTFRYDADIVDTVKTVVPAFLRSWNPTRREWLVYEPVYACELAHVLCDAGHIIIGLDQPTRCDTDPAAWARVVFQRVGAARAHLAYKLLSRLCHPDHGGDHELQTELNAAYAELPDKQRRTA
ncbi:hypothetical protein [uncultured Mycobacterium sp.]|uniref:hypothetical protein n=1 Tax=uncultured Mycobacterium sp. TaxID=171292 RepID=UPI0035C99073